MALTAGLFAPQAAAATAPPPEPIPPPTTELAIDEANPFLPDERNLTDCIGMLQRPGCGSESRGGWHQNVVAIVMVSGLMIVFGRVAWGVRRSQKNAAASTPDP